MTATLGRKLPVTNGSAPARWIAALIGAEAATLAVMALVHLVGTAPSRGRAAGIAEAVIGVVLACAAVQLTRNAPRARETALAAVGFAVVGFLIGLSFTIRGGSTLDLAYHAAMLPLLLVTLAVLLRADGRSSPARPAPAVRDGE
jgi:peptidoglycan/LPS O-acetylase OafA/YrhL